MNIKKRYLPPGWYPASERQTRAKIESFLEELGPTDKEQESKVGRRPIAGVIPHAGWEFSGRLAVDVMRRLDREVGTIIVVGGHLGPADGIYASREEGYETPLGIARADLELLQEIEDRIDLVSDTIPDNTVEVQLPFLQYLFPQSEVLAFRAPPSPASEHLGEVIWEASQKSGKKTVVLGSTDLTHYGDSYGFAPRGYGEDAVRWVKEVNDKRLIDCLVDMNARQAIELALRERSACSVGAAVSALSFAKKAGIDSGKIVSYATSWDVMPSSSFVGYVGLMYP
jgi:AmmeMemoRadiSam system protein B